MRSFRTVEHGRLFREFVHTTLFFELLLNSPQEALAVLKELQPVLPHLLHYPGVIALVLAVGVTALRQAGQWIWFKQAKKQPHAPQPRGRDGRFMKKPKKGGP